MLKCKIRKLWIKTDDSNVKDDAQAKRESK